MGAGAGSGSSNKGVYDFNAAFSPLDINGLVCWLDPDVNIQDGGGNVSQLTQQATVGGNATQGVAGQQPDFTTDGIKAGVNAIFYGDADDALELAEYNDINFNADNEITIAFRHSQLFGVTNRYAFSDKDPGGTKQVSVYMDDVGRWNFLLDDGTNRIHVRANGALGFGEHFLLFEKAAGRTEAALTMEADNDSLPQSTVTSGTLTQGADVGHTTKYIGNNEENTAGFIMLMNHFYIFNKVLTAEEKTSLVNYY